MRAAWAVSGLLLCACGSANSGVGDGGLDLSSYGDGAQSTADLTGADLSGVDLAGVDLTGADLLTAPDAGCAAASCGQAVCGASSCGAVCGPNCPVNTMCSAGVCAGACGGTPCIDAFGGGICEGSSGLRTCPTDGTKKQRCDCSGGGPDAWIGCDPTCI